MAIDMSVPRTRRALLAGGIGGLAALVASALGRPLPASAADGQAVTVGGTFSGTLPTTITNTSPGDAIAGVAQGGGVGVYGESPSYRGVQGRSDAGCGVLGSSLSGTGVEAYSGGIAVYGQSSSATHAAVKAFSTSSQTGLFGWSTEGGMTPQTPPKTGVYGYATQDASARGVTGQTTVGRGVNGQATSGVGTYGYSSSGTGGSFATSTGYALRTSGRVRIDKAAGLATILAGNTVALVKPGLDVTSSSFILLTPRASLGGRDLWYTVNATTNEFSVRVSQAVTADLKVGWLLLG